MYKKITDIRHIGEFPDYNALPYNFLLLCDIDDVMIYFLEIHKTWWKERFDYYYNKNYDMADKATLNDWKKIITNNKPLYTAAYLDSYFIAIKRKGGSVMLVTARDNSMKDITEKHLEYSLKYIDMIHYVGDMDKGQYIRDNIDMTKYKVVHFIDDMLYNVEAVKKHNPMIECFLYENVAPQRLFNKYYNRFQMGLRQIEPLFKNDNWINIHDDNDTPFRYACCEHIKIDLIKFIIRYTVKNDVGQIPYKIDNFNNPLYNINNCCADYFNERPTVHKYLYNSGWCDIYNKYNGIDHHNDKGVYDTKYLNKKLLL